MSERNTALMQRAIEEVWNQGNFAAVDDLFASDYVGHPSPGEETSGSEGVKQFFAAQRAAFPDIHYTVEDLVAEADKVVARWTARATHQGEFMGIPPTGKQGAVAGITIHRIADGTIVEGWTIFDALGLMQQLGVLPSPQPAR